MSASSKPLTLIGSEQVIQYVVTRRPRVTRRLHLELDESGELVVVAPKSWPRYHIVQLLRQNLDYVERFLVQARARQLPPLEYRSGTRHLYRGQALVLDCIHTRGPVQITVDQTEVDRGALIYCGPDLRVATVEKRLRHWYLQQARLWFAEKLQYWQTRASWAANKAISLRLRRMKRTWGTCHQNGTIRLNTHLIKAPEACLDYVIAHELCHLRHMNHGPDFQALQQQLYPDWAGIRAHLRTQGNRYTQE